MPAALPLSFVLLGVAHLASCAPVAGRIALAGLNQRYPHELSTNAPKTPLFAPIPAQIISTPAAAPATSNRRYNYGLPSPTGVIDTSEPTRPYAFPGFLSKLIHTHQDSKASGSDISTTFRNDDPNARGLPFKYLFHGRPPPGSAPITFLSSPRSTGSSSLSPPLDVATTEGSPAAATEGSESSQLPFDNMQMDVDLDAHADPSSAVAPTAESFDIKAATRFVSRFFGMMNSGVSGILGRLKCSAGHEKETLKRMCRYLLPCVQRR